MTMMLKYLLIIAILSVVNGFATLSKPLTSVKSMNVKISPSKASLSMISASAIMPIVKYTASIPLMYSLMSVNEYITHRYYQHNAKDSLMRKFMNFFKLEALGHIFHHAETLDDMSLKMDGNWNNSPASKYLNNNKYRGTAFTWSVTFLMAIQMMATGLPLFSLLGYTPTFTMSLLIPSLLLHGLIWNCLHPFMHGLEDIPLSEGPPAKLLKRFRNSKYFQYLYQNHEGHHVTGGLYNYCVCCPLTDHIVGTYSKESEWRPRQKIVNKTNDANKNQQEGLVIA